MKDAHPFPMDGDPTTTPPRRSRNTKFSFQDVLFSVPKKFHGTNANFQRLKKALEKESTAHQAPFPLETLVIFEQELGGLFLMTTCRWHHAQPSAQPQVFKGFLLAAALGTG